MDFINAALATATAALQQKRAAAKGQGVIEYAGALVVGAVIVSAVIAVGPAGMQTVFTQIITAVQAFFTQSLTQL